MKATAIIGSGYGDEGKGLVTDYVAARDGAEPLVVRFNSGAQAGHTVQTPDGRRHVFGHLCAGTFAGSSTYLSRFYVCHPALFRAEVAALAPLADLPQVFVDPRAPVTTPFDVAVNQALESNRGAARHGSCGVGFGETIERQENSPFHLHARDLGRPERVRTALRQIRRYYLPHRLAALGLPALEAEWTSDAVIEAFVADASEFAEQTTLASLADACQGRDLIFEGAQGLMLDMDYGHFPYVTRSNTGSKNVTALVQGLPITDLELIYVTRAYLTRHGAGPMAHELASKPFASIEDATNLPNAWQGRLRFAWLDLDILAAAVRTDLANAPPLVSTCTAFVTCLDQMVQGRYFQGGTLRTGSPEAVVDAIADALGPTDLIVSRGPTRADVEHRNPAPFQLGPHLELDATNASGAACPP